MRRERRLISTSFERYTTQQKLGITEEDERLMAMKSAQREWGSIAAALKRTRVDCCTHWYTDNFHLGSQSRSTLLSDSVIVSILDRLIFDLWKMGYDCAKLKELFAVLSHGDIRVQILKLVQETPDPVNTTCIDCKRAFNSSTIPLWCHECSEVICNSLPCKHVC